ncbi:MAG: hypothetical protein NC821_02250, partial [Candidatus Omnitrophica bacterium]|nr:hypothetical protein [Candidatus Omnitrophota bacterium]
INEKLLQTQNLLSQIKEERENLKSENSLLTEKAKNLEAQIYSLNEEKLELERRLSSLTELRRAIREIKLKTQAEKREALKQRDTEALLYGNRGYLIRDGKLTLHPKYIIRVLPPQMLQK